MAKQANGFKTLLGLVAVLGLAGCQTVPPLPPVNLKEPGWTVREGQAVWRVNRGAREIAGDILLATRDGQTFAQFAKPPFPLMVARSTPDTWEVEVPMENKRYSGRGKPPARLIWLYLPRVLSGQPPPNGWSWQTLENNGWRLENRHAGELLEGYFNQ